MQFKYAPPRLSVLPFLHQGKTRDTYLAPPSVIDEVLTELLLIDATDRLSTHNVVHEGTIPYKGEVLTALTIFWFVEVLEKAGLRHHLVAYGTKIYDYLPHGRDHYPPDLHLRALIVRKLAIIPIEFIFRTYLTGSLYRDFYSRGIPDPYGLNLPYGLERMAAFAEPLFTPTEKSDDDDPVPSAEVIRRYPEAYELSLSAFLLTQGYLRGKGIIKVDGKSEIGVDRNGLHYVADECATPDSDRFALDGSIKTGEDPPWFDKQVARDCVEEFWRLGYPRGAIIFPPRVVDQLTHTYLEIFARVTGSDLRDFQRLRLS